MLPRKNALNTQPYSPTPPRSCLMSGRIVATASDSNATSVMVETSPTVRARRSGAQTPCIRSVYGPQPWLKSSGKPLKARTGAEQEQEHVDLLLVGRSGDAKQDLEGREEVLEVCVDERVGVLPDERDAVTLVVVGKERVPHVVSEGVPAVRLEPERVAELRPQLRAV